MAQKKRSELWRPISQIRVQITSQNFHQVCVTSLRIGIPNYNTVPSFSSQQSYVELSKTFLLFLPMLDGSDDWLRRTMKGKKIEKWYTRMKPARVLLF